MKLALNLLMTLAAACFLAVAGIFSCGLDQSVWPAACSYVTTQVRVSDELRNAALLVIGMLATVTWVIGQLLSHLRARQQHTISLTVMRLTNDNLVEDIDFVEAQIPRGAVLPERVAVLYVSGRPQALTENELKLMQAIKRIANYYEFLSEAYIRHAIDRDVLQSTLSGSFIEFYKRVWPYVLSAQKRYDATELRARSDKPPVGDAFEQYQRVISMWGARLAEIEKSGA